jgi:hypothetical protein
VPFLRHGIDVFDGGSEHISTWFSEFAVYVRKECFRILKKCLEIAVEPLLYLLGSLLDSTHANLPATILIARKANLSGGLCHVIAS